MKLTLIFIILFQINSSFGQSKKDLIGEWKTDNPDSSYFNSDTIILYQDINHFCQTGICNLIEWTIEKNDFKLYHVNLCVEPPISWTSDEKQDIGIKRKENQRIIELKLSNNIIELFQIIEYA